MKANVTWYCRVPICSKKQETTIDTADLEPHDLVCNRCGKPQYARLSLQNFVVEGVRP